MSVVRQGGRVVRRGAQVSPRCRLEKSIVTLRKVPATLTLGLLASLAAHTALFGQGHAMGGGYHAALVQTALAGALCLLAFFGALAWNGSAGTADGSVVAARLRARLPGAASLFAATLLWYGAAETLEPHHAPVSMIVAILALAGIAWLLLRLANAIVTIVAGAVIAVRSTPFAPRAIPRSRRPRTHLVPRRAPFARRRFARPPPVLALIRA